MSGVIFSQRDAARTREAVLAYENRIISGESTKDPPRRFFQVTPFKMFQLLESAAPPESPQKPVAVKAQPFEGETPQLIFQDERDEYGNLLPVEETIYHALPGLRLCDRTLVFAVQSEGAWRIIHAEQWPVMVQQIDADGFPDGTVDCTLVIDETSHAFSLSTHATKEQLLTAVRSHPRILDPLHVKAIGGPLTYCAINLMFGPSMTGKTIEPLQISNLGLPPGQGLRLRLLAPTWSD
ncbi:hypothetical protein [Rubinisphaera italica]|uniref:Uncharacterized protein n=1 Tax=Rubinisphaera italica TaxID=2527969 RepID=A0A5C5XJP7_9PLAN|nr:hypothetical protein [Rubinisphaera italica]TWT63200.1 hypothetical protein Pan54_39530 [Rubinisphaera italica]